MEQKLRKGTGGLKAIPGVISASFGKNYTQRSQGYTHAIVVRLKDKQAEQDYQTDKVHTDLRDTLLKPLFMGTNPVLALDYEHTPPACPFGPMSFLGVGAALGALAACVTMKLARN